MPDVAMRRGAAGPSVATTAAEDRERLTDAAVRVAIERGYEALDVEQIARYAGLSMDDFHRHFVDEEQCILAAYDRFLDQIGEHIDEACEGVREWPERVKLAIEAAFDFVAELEAVARFFVVDVMRAGAVAVDRRCTSIDRAAARLKEGRLLHPVAADYPAVMERTLVAGVVLTASSHLLAEDGYELPDLEAEAVELVLTPYIGTRRARRVATA